MPQTEAEIIAEYEKVMRQAVLETADVRRQLSLPVGDN